MTHETLEELRGWIATTTALLGFGWHFVDPIGRVWRRGRKRARRRPRP